MPDTDRELRVDSPEPMEREPVPASRAVMARGCGLTSLEPMAREYSPVNPGASRCVPASLEPMVRAYSRVSRGCVLGSPGLTARGGSRVSRCVPASLEPMARAYSRVSPEPNPAGPEPTARAY
ncbi:hypothetical protein, partial [Enterocloster asparagiformis]|uniref:hypothetical protein n=1 Tax=Enterocloster asparagiformis TaxID=333367 RepID=UPI0011C22EAC